MIVIGGKEVFQEIEEVVDPKHTAVLCIDMQNDFCRDDGKAVAAGIKINAFKAAIAPIKRLLDAAREVPDVDLVVTAGEHADVELVDVAPSGQVQRDALEDGPDRVERSDACIARCQWLARTGDVRHDDVHWRVDVIGDVERGPGANRRGVRPRRRVVDPAFEYFRPQGLVARLAVAHSR